MEEVENGDERFCRYLIISPENGGFWDLFRFMFWPPDDKLISSKFIQCSDESTAFDKEEGGADVTPPDRRWVIFVSIIVRKILIVCRKPMEWTGYFVDFILNLVSLNHNLLRLLFNFFQANGCHVNVVPVEEAGKVVMPRRGSETFISTIGHIDGRIELDPSYLFVEGKGLSSFGEGPIQMDICNRALMDLCIMASKLAYENANVVRNVVNAHWKMHFVDFYNCWNDYQKERSTQVFIFCDKPKDANLILISFRGTEPFDADDWATDFDYSWYEIPEVGKIHMGFLEGLGLGSRANTSTFSHHLQTKNKATSLLPEVSDSLSSSGAAKQEDSKKMTAYYAVRNKLKSLLKEHKNAKFMVTGHSLGGALAILFPTVLVVHEEEEVMQRLMGIHTFGQPRVGNRQMCRFMQSHLEEPVAKYFRVVYCNDLVPRLPYDDKTFLYKHFGVCLYYNSFFTEQRVKEEPNRNYFGWRFLVPEYVNAMWELVRSVGIGYVKGPEYKETWEGVLMRVFGLVIPGLSAHAPPNYINSIRLGRGVREEELFRCQPFS